MQSNKVSPSSWFRSLFAPRTDFYALMNRHANTVLLGMEELSRWIHAGGKERCQKVRDLEREADELKLDLERKLNESFVTPFDREDIYDLAAQLDEVINAAKSAVREIEALGMVHGPAISEMVSTLVEGTRCLKHAFENLNKDHQEAANQAYLARKSENRFSRTYRIAMRELFAMDDVKQVLKTREVYRMLVHASERIDRVGEKLLHVIIKIS